MNPARRISDAFNHNQEIICCFIKIWNVFTYLFRYDCYTHRHDDATNSSHVTLSHMIHVAGDYVQYFSSCEQTRAAVLNV